MGKKLTPIRWMSNTNAYADEVFERFRSEKAREVLTDNFFAEAYARRDAQAKFSDRMSILSFGLLAALILAETGGGSSFSILGLTLSDLVQVRGFALFLASFLLMISVFVQGGVTANSKALGKLGFLRYGENFPTISNIRWGGRFDVFGAKFYKMNIGEHMHATLPYSLSIIISACLLAGAALVVAAIYWGTAGYLLYQEWLYPSLEGALYWLVFWATTASFFASLLWVGVYSFKMPFKDYTFTNKWAEVRKYDEEKARKMLSEFYD